MSMAHCLPQFQQFSATPIRIPAPQLFSPIVFVPWRANQRNNDTAKIHGRFQFSLHNKGMMHGGKDYQLHVLDNRSGTAEIDQEGHDLVELKKSVMQAVSNTNRGKDTTSDQKKNILRQIKALEACNPTTKPIDSPLLSGLWSLLYTAPTDEEKVDKYAGAEEGPFLARLKPLAFRSVRQTASFQVIDTAGGSVQNIADFVFFGMKGSLVIKGKAVKSSTLGKESVRIEVTFESFSLRIGGWQSSTIPLDWVNPKGWVDTTFLDQDLRVGRGDKGSIFVSARVKKL